MKPQQGINKQKSQFGEMRHEKREKEKEMMVHNKLLNGYAIIIF